MTPMVEFASKVAPSDDKLRGGYYTPAPIADFLSDWVAEAGPVLLEPSCGDGNILAFLAKHSSQVVAVELSPEEAAKSTDRTGVDVAAADFFSWFTADQHGTFDGVAGNPPYIRFGNWTDPTRGVALDLMRDHGLRPNKLTNAWVPFVVASIAACRDGGRVGLVLPAELMQVGYAAELRQYLIDNCATISVVCFRRLVFPGILQEIVLLLAEKGAGPALIQVVEVDDSESLRRLKVDTNPTIKAPLHASEKWTKYFLSPKQVRSIRRLKADKRLRKLVDYASVDVGVVTGRNSYFVMSSAVASDNQIHDLTISLVSRSAQLKGTVYTESDQQANVCADMKTRLLDARGIALSAHSGLNEYVTLGERHEVHTGYKCRIRKQWWVVPSIWEADAFMLRQIHTHPKIVANFTDATSTDTVHRLRLEEGVDAAKLATAAFNSLTFAVSEVVGRSYGGGILELEPSEAEELPLPNPSLVTDSMVKKVDRLVRNRQVEQALAVVDNAILIQNLGFTQAQVDEANSIWQTLRDRRNRRGSKQA